MFHERYHKYDRCEYCGRWSIVKRLRSEELAAAEAGEVRIQPKI